MEESGITLINYTSESAIWNGFGFTYLHVRVMDSQISLAFDLAVNVRYTESINIQNTIFLQVFMSKYEGLGVVSERTCIQQNYGNECPLTRQSISS